MEQEIPQTSVCKADEAVCGEAALRTVSPACDPFLVTNALLTRPSERTQPRSLPPWVDT